MMKIDQMPAKTIAGIYIKTTCQEGAAIPAIRRLWRKTLKEKTLETLPGKRTNDLYAIYLYNHPTTPYEYTFILGYEIDTVQTLPEPFSAFTLPQEKYLHTQTIGNAPQIITETWPKIWQYAKENNHPFAFTADYEVYKQGDYLGQTNDQTIVEIFASISK